jgi:hypothetical protein
MAEQRANPEEILNTWKEIALYLEVDKRTAQRYEDKMGLPVHRLGKSARSRVFAYKQDLDQWRRKYEFKTAAHRNEKIDPAPAPIPRIRLQWKYVFLFILVPLLIIALFLILTNLPDGQPADFNIKHSRLIILDNKGNTLWEFDTRLSNLCNEERYRRHFQFKHFKVDPREFTLLIIDDFDKDGNNEVLFSTQIFDDSNALDTIYYFDHKGKKLWEFVSGRRLTFGKKEYPRHFRVRTIQTCDLDGDNQPEIVFLAAQYPEFPSQLAILDLKGNLKSEYWNSGHMRCLLFKDLNNDGRKEIIAAGTNNEYKKGFLAVLDSGDVKGGSPQQLDKYTCPALEKGSEKYYILLPRTDLDKIEQPIEHVVELVFLENGNLSVIMQSTNIYYEFNPRFELVHIDPTHTFEQRHKEAVRKGKINSRLDDRYLQQLAENILYFNGKQWTTTPAMSNEW